MMKLKQVAATFFLGAGLLLSGCSSDESIVQNGTLNFDSSVTLSDAFDNYEFFSDSDWSSFEDRQNRQFVEFVGNINIDAHEGTSIPSMGIEVTEEILEKSKENFPDDLELDLKVQFKISKVDDSFEIHRIFMTIRGTNMKTGEYGEADTPLQMDAIESVYSNVPILGVFGLIHNAGSQ
ncbi:hypothetical protein QX776_08650 [Alteromonadaceae bacterium BrNp21-10]|nr:hypothetical protein [Alteromonadaceae bacterium BrNp21-10]